jgi:hypothetical protein
VRLHFDAAADREEQLFASRRLDPHFTGLQCRGERRMPRRDADLAARSQRRPRPRR